MNPKIILIIIGTLLPCFKVLAQEDKVVNDSVMIIHDSLRYKTIDKDSETNPQDSTKYKDIEDFSRKARFTMFLHRFIFRPLGREKSAPVKVKPRLQKPIRRFEGKIIRKILITTLDPFGFSIGDTSARPGIFLMKAGNSLHVKTNSSIIKNLLLFEENERYDSLLVKESERLIRQQKYVRDVLFNVISSSRDSVDIYIRVLDVWSIIPGFSNSGASIGFELTDLNFAGFGNRFEGRTLWKRPGNENITHIGYLMPNIRNSYVSMNIQYLFSANSLTPNEMEFQPYFFSPFSDNPKYIFSDNKNIIKSIEIVRSFYTPLTKWAGGLFLGQIMTTQSYLDLDSIRYLSSLTNIQDYWVGRSWQLNKWNPARERITSLVLSARLAMARTPERSDEAINADVFNRQNYYFAGISFTSRRYLQDKYIFNYGLIEDVPEGRTIGLTIGMESQKNNRMYVGLNAGWGGYHRIGYISSHFEYGTFKGQSGLQQGVFTGRINYNTKLMSIGNWKIRQFIRPSFIFGINRFPADNLTQNIGIKGFQTLESDAKHLTIISLQTQSYAPWNLAGFHLGPFFFSHFGMLGKESSSLKNSRLYSLIGFGLLIKNDYLMFSTFQISLSFYPYIPGRGNNILRTNAYKTSDYGFMDFEVLKPGIVEFR